MVWPMDVLEREQVYIIASNKAVEAAQAAFTSSAEDDGFLALKAESLKAEEHCSSRKSENLCLSCNENAG